MEKIRCEKCNSAYTYTTSEYVVCRKCGHKEKHSIKSQEDKTNGRAKDNQRRSKGL